MGFLPYWEVSDAVLDYELLSTIAYFSVGSDKNGNLLKLDPTGRRRPAGAAGPARA